MKKLIHKVIDSGLKCIGIFLNVIYPYAFSLKIKYYKTKIYTYWHSTEFKNFGENSILNYPIYFWGKRYISIGNSSGIGTRGNITAWDKHTDDLYNPEIIIGDHVWIGDECHITAINKIDIGNHVLMGKKVTISDNAHGMSDFELLSIPPDNRKLYSKGPVIIEDRVWIGDKVTILSGVRIGENSIIGANALVTKDIPANCIAGGVPAKIIKILK